MKKEGQKAPAFSLRDKDGETYSLKSIESEWLVVYFYPKDNTPGCTTEAVEFSKLLKKFEELGASVIGISGGNDKSKARFCDKHKLKVTLLSDPDFKVAEKYGSYGEKKFMGKTIVGIHRKTFVLDPDRRIAKIFDSVKAAGHAKEVLSTLKELQGNY